MQSKKENSWARDFKVNYQLYILMALPFIWLIIFRYAPMYGVQIAFKKYMVSKGILGSDWVGFDHFSRFFKSYQFSRVMVNTVVLSFYQLLAGFPIPIILALAMNATTHKGFKKTVQMVTYAPHFISIIVMVGMLLQFLNPQVGVINMVRNLSGLEPVDFMGKPELFRSLYVWSGVWQSAGWGTIIYLAALAAIDPELHEAAIVDGAGRFKRILHIDIPGILPTAVIMLILNVGRVMNLGFEKVFLMQNPLNLRVSEIISTYVYKVGLGSARANYSYAAAIGLFNSLINFFLIVTVNRIAKTWGETSLW